MRIDVGLGGDQAFALQHILLVYGDGRRAFVTLHEPAPAADGGAPRIGPGRPLGTEFLKQLAGDLGQALPADVLPPEVLVRTSEVTVWWRRPSMAPLFYTTKGELGTEIVQLSGVAVPHPALVFRATARGLWVRALFEDTRPTAATVLAAAPYYNVGRTGSVCLGTMRRPDVRGLDALPQWEASFFASEFTHALPRTKLTSHPEGFAAMWSALAGRMTAGSGSADPVLFPVEWLAPAPDRQTLGAFVDADKGGDW